MRKTSFKNLCSAPVAAGMRHEKMSMVGWPQDTPEHAATSVKATTTAARNRNNFNVPDEIKEMEAEAAKCRDIVRRKLLRKRAREARWEFETGRALLPVGEVIHRPVVTKLWINGRASEDRNEWTKEVRAPCTRRK